MNSIFDKSLPAVTIAILLFALIPYLFPCSLCYDDCCDGAISCGSPSNQCFCGLTGMDSEKGVRAKELAAAGDMKSFGQRPSTDDFYREFYRPPEITITYS